MNLGHAPHIMGLAPIALRAADRYAACAMGAAHPTRLSFLRSLRCAAPKRGLAL